MGGKGNCLLYLSKSNLSFVNLHEAKITSCLEKWCRNNYTPHPADSKFCKFLIFVFIK